MESRTLARPYAKAVFELAQADGRLAAWSSTLDALAAVVGTPQVGRLLGTPAVGRDEMARIVGDALLEGRGGADDPAEAQVRALLRLLAENRRLLLAPLIAEEYESQRAAAEARIDVEITTAVADVPAAQRTTLERAIAKRLQREVTIRWASDPELISGAEIRAGDLVIDGSLRGELQRLSQSLVR
ncbi:MAG TPA: F0F1 ATP synthase subunit delta [Nevskiaceae bacterium]|nr:F0F1 ATP synthase subunit delta [Nevskiaceae bacterium]